MIFNIDDTFFQTNRWSFVLEQNKPSFLCLYDLYEKETVIKFKISDAIEFSTLLRRVLAEGKQYIQFRRRGE